MSKIQSIRGFCDIIENIETWQSIEEILKNISKRYGYDEVRTPLLEESRLFERSIGITSDIVHKEMYTFTDKNEVNLSEVAQLVGMNPSAFSRFFKRTHRKTFSRYLNEVRIGYACKLLLENENNITGTAYESGFNNISNFNRQFRAIKKMSPKDYIKSYKKSE